MEFKGTKGKWEYHGGDNYSIDIILPDNTTISVDRTDRYTGVYSLSCEGMEANAKLISCAPEMLEMLIKCNNINSIAREHINEDLFKDLEKLIKKATTI